MELKSRLGEYGSVGAGGADCATEAEMNAITTNGRQAMSSFLIGVLIRELMFDLIQRKTLLNAQSWYWLGIILPTHPFASFAVKGFAFQFSLLAISAILAIWSSCSFVSFVVNLLLLAVSAFALFASFAVKGFAFQFSLLAISAILAIWSFVFLRVLCGLSSIPS